MITGADTALALPRPAEASLTAVLVLATAVWIGGLVAIFVVARVAHATLGRASGWRSSAAWAVRTLCRSRAGQDLGSWHKHQNRSNVFS